MVRISAIINTLNEARYLPECIKSLNEVADEIVVVDMQSSDNTQEVAKKLGATVYEHERMGYVELARNYAIEKAKGKWILIIDPDERLPKPLAKKLLDITKKPDADFYRLPRKNIIFRKWIKHSRWWPDYNIRFFKKGHVSWNEVIHSVPMTVGKGKDLPALEKYAITHRHYQTIEQYIDRLNRYTTHQAKQLISDNYKFDWRDLISKPSNEFISRYFKARGYKDGLHGLALSLLQSFSELVVYLKVWQEAKFDQAQVNVSSVINQFKEQNKDQNYWYADTLLKVKGGLINKFKRKFKLP